MALHQRFLDRAKRGTSTCSSWATRSPRAGTTTRSGSGIYGPRHAANFGIGGDRTQHVLWRIQNGELEGIHPKVVVLMIGTNNAGLEHRRRDRRRGHGHRQGAPDPAPRGQGPAPGRLPPRPEARRDSEEARGGEPADLASSTTASTSPILDIGKAFLNADGTISPDIMPDYLHLTAKGYRIWADAMEPTLWKLLDEPSSEKVEP